MEPSRKEMSFKFLLLAGSGVTPTTGATIEAVLKAVFQNSVFGADIVTVTTLEGAKKALENDDFDLAILSANVRQRFDDAALSPEGVKLVNFMRDPAQRNSYTPIILTSGDGRLGAEYASDARMVYLASTNSLASREEAARIVGTAMGSDCIKRDIGKAFRNDGTCTPVAPAKVFVPA